MTLLLATIPATGAAAEPIGPCRFDTERLSFAGSPMDQAACLLRDPAGTEEARHLPAVLQRLLSARTPPTAAQTAAALARMPEPYAGYASNVAKLPASRTEQGKPLAYFVIHDTSWPRIDQQPLPPDLDRDPKINSFRYYLQPEPVAHVFVNRAGQLWAAYDVAVPWRATKLESFVVGTRARGRFYHVELVQPRRRALGETEWRPPEPGFSPAQYRLLAALYVYASARAERWLIPAFHSAVDAGIPEAHDDPQNFDLNAFATELERLVYSQ